MLGLHQMTELKKAFFSNLLEMKCYDMQSFSLLMIIGLIRFISQLTIINIPSLINNSSFAYFQQVYKIEAIFSKSGLSTILLTFVCLVIIFSCLFLGFLFTISSSNKTKHARFVYLKVFGLFVYTFRVFLVKNFVEIGFSGTTSGDILWRVLLGVAVILIGVISIIMEEFSIEISLNHQNKSLLSKSYHFFNSISEIILLLTVILTSFVPADSITFVSILSFLLASSFAFKLLTSTLRQKYSSNAAETIQRIICVSGIVFYLLAIPGYYIQLLKQNLFITISIVTVFCFSSFINYLNSFRQQSFNYLESIPRTKEQLLSREGKFHLFQAHFLIHYVKYMITEYKGEREQILLSSILAEHFRICKREACYCVTRSDDNINRLMMDHQFRRKFLLAFVENIYKEFSYEFDIFALYLMFKLQIIGIFPEIQYNLLKYQTSNSGSLKMSHQYIIFLIKNTLKGTLDQKNRSCDYVRVEKAILQEQKAKKLLESLQEIVNLSIKRSKLLSEGICNLRQVEDNVSKTSSVIKQIQLAYHESKQKNEFNLYTQSIFYFYYTKISQTNSDASQIFSNIYSKSNFLKSLKGITVSNIEKFLYENQCCVLQSNLDPQNMGVITNLTLNCIQVFDMRKDELLYRNIKKIIPKMMNEEHEALMQSWLLTSTYNTINQQKNIFMATVKNICFKAIVYHQISTSFQRIKIYTMVLKVPGQNYLLLNRNMKIEGLGEKIKDSVFSVKTLKESLKNYCLNPRMLPEDIENINSQRDQKVDLLFCEEKGSLGQIRDYNTSASLAEQIQQFANKALRGNREVRVLKCKAELSAHRFGKIPYCVIKFLDVVQHTMLQSDVDQMDSAESYSNSSRFDKKSDVKKNKSKKKLLLGENSFTPMTLSECPQHDQFYQEMREDQKSSSKADEQNSLMNVYELDDLQKQSTSSMATQSTGYSFKKLIKQIKERFLFQKNIKYPELNTITVVLALLIIVLFVALIAQYVFYRSRLQSFQKIMQANQQVSDTLQYMQLMYSQSLLVYQNCMILRNETTCQRAVQEISYSYNYLFEQVSTQMQNLLSHKATQDFLYYTYLQQQVRVKLGSSYSSMEIQAFLSIFYYTVQKIALLFTNNMATSEQSDYLFSILSDNWQTIVNINHQTLQLYQQKGLHQMDIISIILYCISGAVIIIDLFIFSLINYFMMSFIKKKQQIVRNYEWVPISYVEEMKKYYQMVGECLQRQKLNSSQAFEFPNVEDNSYYRPKNQFFYATSSVKRIFFLGLFFLCMTLSNVVSLLEMRKVLEPFEIIFIEEKQMISSQKVIIQAYYQLKTNYLIEKNQTRRQQRLANLQNNFKKKQVEFNDRAIKLLQIFNDSSSYFNDFKSLLIQDICQLSSPLVNQWEYSACKNAQSPQGQYGIFPTMLFIQRTTMIGASIFKTIPIEAVPEALGDRMYLEIDLYIIYVVKVFYLMQKRINTEMQTFLQSAYFACLLLILLQFFLVFIGIAMWAWFFGKNKQKFSQLYGQVILFPNKIIIKNKQVMKKIEDGLVIKDY